MKSLTSYAAAVLLLLTLMCSCKKDNGSNNNQTVNVTIQSTETYQYDLGSFGDEEGAIISRQAMHYQTSSINRIACCTNYEYKPALNFTGTDEVEIKSMRGSDGASPNNKITITTIKLTISK